MRTHSQSLRRFVWLVLACCPWAMAWSQSPVAGTLDTLRAAYSNQVAVILKEAGTEREKIQAQVWLELKTLEDRLAARADLQALVQCQKAQKLAAEGWLEWSLEKPGAEIASLQRNVLLAQGRLDDARRRRLETLRRQYLNQLEQAKVTLTRQKKVEEALRVQQVMEEVRKEMVDAAAEPSVKPTPVATRPAGRPPLPGARNLLYSFEEEKDLKAWEVRAGAPVSRVERHATEGRFALAAHAGNLLVTTALPKDWRAFKSLEIDYHLEGQKTLNLEITLGDQPWLDNQTYWNRHNRLEEIKDGSGTLVIPTKDLYRGEKGVKNKELSKDLALDQMRYLALQLGAASEAVVHLDAIRLVK